jgi:hypothetical protein
MVKLMADFATVDPNPQFKFNLRGWLFYHFVCPSSEHSAQLAA